MRNIQGSISFHFYKSSHQKRVIGFAMDAQRTTLQVALHASSAAKKRLTLRHRQRSLQQQEQVRQANV
jgi:hypothetical protein